MHCFGLPLLIFAKRLFGTYIKPKKLWEEEMPHKLTRRIYDQLKIGIISYPKLQSHVNTAFQERRPIDQQYLQMAYYPFVRALQMVHKSFYDKDWLDRKENPHFWCKLSRDDRKELRDVEPLLLRHPELSTKDILIRPFPHYDALHAARPCQHAYLNGRAFGDNASDGEEE